MPEISQVLSKENEEKPITAFIENEIDPFEEIENDRHQQGNSSFSSPKKEIEEISSSSVAPPKKIVPKKEIEASDNPDEKFESLKLQLEKEKKNAYEAQKWGTKNSQKVKTAEKHLKAMLENGSFTVDEEEELKKALELLTSSADEPELPIPSQSLHPLQKYFDIANNELPKFRTYGDDSNLDNKIGAFNAFVKDASPEEISALIDDLESVDDDALKIKKMLSWGEKNYNEGFKEILESGGMKKTIDKKNKEIEKLNKELEKYKKKLTEYEDYDKTTRYGISEIRGTEDEAPETFEDPYDELESTREQALAKKRR